MPEAPARTVLGQRALELPTVLVTNQHSLSDAEDFTEGYRTLKLGAGRRRADGGLDHLHVEHARSSTARRSACRACACKAADGTDMEMHPRPVDVPVTRPIGETLVGKDSQLDEAVGVLLKKLGRAE